MRHFRMLSCSYVRILMWGNMMVYGSGMVSDLERMRGRTARKVDSKADSGRTSRRSMPGNILQLLFSPIFLSCVYLQGVLAIKGGETGILRFCMQEI